MTKRTGFQFTVENETSPTSLDNSNQAAMGSPDKKHVSKKNGNGSGPDRHQVVGDPLRESEIRYRRLFETAKDGILILDAKTGRITDSKDRKSVV